MECHPVDEEPAVVRLVADGASVADRSSAQVTAVPYDDPVRLGEVIPLGR